MQYLCNKIIIRGNDYIVLCNLLFLEITIDSELSSCMRYQTSVRAATEIQERILYNAVKAMRILEGTFCSGDNLNWRRTFQMMIPHYLLKSVDDTAILEASKFN